MAPAPATRAGPALAAVPVTPASGSRGERKGTRARGKAGGHADFRQHSSCCLCYTTQPGKYTSRTAGVPRCLFPHLTARLQPVQPAEVQQHGCGCGGQRGSPVPQEQREVCHRHCCTRAVDAASPALLTAQAVSSSLEAAPGQLSSSWAACGTATARKAEEQVAVSTSGQGQLEREVFLLLGLAQNDSVPGLPTLGRRAGWQLAVEAFLVEKQ